MKIYDQNWQNVRWIRLFLVLKWFRVNTGTVLNACQRGSLDMKTSWNGKIRGDWQRFINISIWRLLQYFLLWYTIWKCDDIPCLSVTTLGQAWWEILANTLPNKTDSIHNPVLIFLTLQTFLMEFPKYSHWYRLYPWDLETVLICLIVISLKLGYLCSSGVINMITKTSRKWRDIQIY